MIRGVFDRIFNEFQDAKEQSFANHPLAEYFRGEVPRIFSQAFPVNSDLLWRASAGKGRWADAPWIAAFNPLVTESAEKGYYPVYLFNRSIDTVYLSLNQGMTELRAEFSDQQARETLRHRASILRSRLSPGFQMRFSTEPIDLQPESPASRLAWYEPGHAFGLRYEKGRLPKSEQMLADLGDMLSLYRLAVASGGTSEADQRQHGSEDEERTFEENRRYSFHRTIDRNPRLAKEAKRIHGYVCEVCGFNFEEAYGELGHLYIEAHHLKPLSELPLDSPVSYSPVDDFAVVCGNCHRMLHRKNAPKEFDDFVELVRRK